MSLARYTPPVVEKPACTSCRAMAPECMVPVGDGAEAMCWLCAHMITAHDAEPGVPSRDCGCSSEQIYPSDYRALFAPKVVVLDGDLLCDHTDPAQCTGCRTLARKLVHVTSPSYGLDGKRDRTGPVVVQTFVRTNERELQPVSVAVREPSHSDKVARGMRAARILRRDSE